MDRKSYDNLADILDALLAAENVTFDVVSELLNEAAAKRADRWVGPATLRIIRAWCDEARTVREVAWTKALADAGWTDAEFDAELTRRVDAAAA